MYPLQERLSVRLLSDEACNVAGDGSGRFVLYFYLSRVLSLLVCIVALCAKLRIGQQIQASTYSMGIPTLAQIPADHLQQKHLSFLAKQTKQFQKCLLKGCGSEHGRWCIILPYGYPQVRFLVSYVLYLSRASTDRLGDP